MRSFPKLNTKDHNRQMNAADLMERKNVMRRAAYDARNAQEDKDTLSSLAVAKLIELPEYQAAKTVLWYIDCRSELRTRQALPAAMADGKKIVVPYCTIDDQGANKLGLWWLERMDELVIGKWKILEPPQEQWNDPPKVVSPEELDLVIVPGVGFSRNGGRMGNGQGYYDRLLQQVRTTCPLIGLCFECQLFDELVVGPHDVFMNRIVTETAVYGDGKLTRT